MSWPHLAGYLFLRFEGQVTAPMQTVDAGPPDAGNADARSADGGHTDGGPADGGPADGGPAESGPVNGAPVDGGSSPITAIHMGGVIGRLFAPTAHAGAALSIPASGTIGKHLRVVMDEIFLGASANVDLTNFVSLGPETVPGERLRQTVPSLPIFELLP
jgi:hypothetical protein